MMRALLGNSSMPNYVKLIAAGLLGTTYLAALIVAVDTYITQGPTATMPNVIAVIIGSGLGISLNILGIHQGAQLTETNKEQ
jgi:hypothetical protein